MKKRLIRELFDRGKKNPKLKMSRKSESQMKKTRYGFSREQQKADCSPGMHHK